MTANEAAVETRFVIDKRLGNNPRYRLVTGDDDLMQIPSEILKCVAFIYCNPRGEDDWRPMGTAFLLGYDHKTKGRFVYFVTAKHVIDKIEELSRDNKVLLRVNTKNGGSDVIETDVDHWQFHPTEETVDVAVLFVDDQARRSDEIETDLQSFPSSMILTAKVSRDLNVRLGEDVVITGLFFHHMGEERNLPIVRTGSLAANRIEPVWDDAMKAHIDAYLVEIRSLGGLSGSPVFLYPGVSRWLNPEEGVTQTASLGPSIYWLGLVHGHWDTSDQINSGIATVIPAEKVMEVLERDDFEEQRTKKFIERKKRFGESVLDSAAPAEPDFTKADFDEALRKVSRRKKPSESGPAS